MDDARRRKEGLVEQEEQFRVGQVGRIGREIGERNGRADQRLQTRKPEQDRLRPRRKTGIAAWAAEEEAEDEDELPAKGLKNQLPSTGQVGRLKAGGDV